MTNFVTVARGLALALILGAGVASIASANMIVPAKDTEGTITAIDAQKGEVTVAGKTFLAAASDLRSLNVGDDVRVQYIESGKGLLAMWFSWPRPHTDDTYVGE